MKTFIFKSNKVRKRFSIAADCAQDAANQAKKFFGGIIARREYGKKGFIHLDKWICEGRVEAFACIPCKNGGNQGKNVIFDVDLISEK